MQKIWCLDFHIFPICSFLIYLLFFIFFELSHAYLITQKGKNIYFILLLSFYVQDKLLFVLFFIKAFLVTLKAISYAN